MRIHIPVVALLATALVAASSPTQAVPGTPPPVAAAKAGAAAAAPAPAAPGAAATVNGVAIPAEKVEGEVKAETSGRETEGAPPLSPADEAALRKQVIERFIATELIFQAARAAKIAPTERSAAAVTESAAP